MLKLDQKTGRPVSIDGGYSQGLPIRDTYVRIGDGMQYMHCLLYEPVAPVEESSVGVIIIHSDDDYSMFPIGAELAKRGFRTLCGQVTRSGNTLDSKILDVGNAVRFMKNYGGIRKVVLMGHSGGATLMSAYQSIAENGAGIYQTEQNIIRCTVEEKLIPADAVMLLDSNWGNGSMTLFSIDPAVTEEGNGTKLDPELDIFNPKNGFDPEGSHYSDEFIKRFCEAQAERNNRLLLKAQDRLHAIEKGMGNFADDEPFVVAGGAQFAPCNKLIPQDTRLVSHTKEAHDLLHADGTVTHEIIHCLRKPKFTESVTPIIASCLIGTVRDYLTNRAVPAGADYQIREDCVTGIEWNRTYNCTPGNIRFVHAPLLVMGMTGSYEYLAAEAVFANAASEDKTLCFSEASSHNFFLQEGIETVPGQYGDPAKAVFDKAAAWMRERMI